MPASVIIETLRHTWRTLTPLQVPMALMGGLAVAVWKHPRMTQDVDILVDFDNVDLALVLRTLEQARMRPKRNPPILQIGPQRIVQVLYQPPGTFLDIQVDLLIAEGAYQKAALSRCVPTRLPDSDAEVAVLSCEDLILHKLLAGRILDRADAAVLLRANRNSLDMSYLEQWAKQLDVQKDMAAIWEEAFPGGNMSRRP